MVEYNTLTRVRKNTGAVDTGTQRRLNLIEGANVTLTMVEDEVDGEVDVQIASAGGVTVHNLGGDSHNEDSLANLNSKVSDATLDDSSAERDPKAHAPEHTDGTDDIRNATAAQKGVATAAQITKLDGIEASADITDAVNVGTTINGVGAKDPPIDADKVPLIDTAAANVLKTSTWTVIKAFLKTYFDTLYNLYVHPNHSGEVTSVADGAQTIATAAVTLAKMADMATASLIYRKTAATGVPEVNTLATLKTDLDLTGTNSGDNPGVTAVTGTSPVVSSGGTTPAISMAAATAAAAGHATAAQITKLDGIASGADVTGSNAPQAHAASHQNGGTDEPSVVGLSGLLADDQHVIDAEAVSAVEAAGLTFAEDKGITLDPALSADGKWSGIVEAGTAGAILAFGDVVYQALADSKWELAKADVAATSDGKLGICVAAAAEDAATVILLWGKVRGDTAFPSFSVMRPIYISAATAGDLTSTKPTGTTNFVVRIVGYGNTADELFFCPDNSYVELA